MIARLTITLDGVRPSVVRRIEVPLTIRLDQLHLVFQAVMGWENQHLYAFWPGRAYQRGSISYGNNPEPEPDDLPATEITLANFMAVLPKRTFVYVYDFGDDWHHTVRITIGDRAVTATYPRLLSAIGRCPPEDVGGAYGYADYLEILADPQHKRHAEMIGWRGQFDPDSVDTQAIETRLREMFPFGL